eukprot:749592-Hanusia_phi.AAC.5
MGGGLQCLMRANTGSSAVYCEADMLKHLEPSVVRHALMITRSDKVGVKISPAEVQLFDPPPRSDRSSLGQPAARRAALRQADEGRESLPGSSASNVSAPGLHGDRPRSIRGDRLHRSVPHRPPSEAGQGELNYSWTRRA